ncbi:DUF7619 domain-containing protein [Nibribacter koreensis]|uniref:Uncharacterized protein n=1 Tax=Nibribacter koreensis TaxID=1084519 RepID=A0ABP8F5J5_9BACT
MKKALLLLCSFLFLQSAFSQKYNFQEKAQIGITVTSPFDVAVDKEGNLYILEQNTITKSSPDGKLLASFPIGTNTTRIFTSLALDQMGNMYVSDTYCQCIQKFDPAGKPLMSIGAKGTADGQFLNMGKIAIGQDQTLYVADARNARVQKLSLQGQYLGSIGASVVNGGAIGSPTDISLDGQGNVYVLDNTKALIHKYSHEGALLQQFSTPQPAPGSNTVNNPSFTVTETGGYFLVNSYNKTVYKYDAEGVLLTQFAGYGNQDDALLGNYLNLALDAEGNLYASDSDATRASVKKYSPWGFFLKKYGKEFNYSEPAFDLLNNLYVFDINSKEIHKYNAQGVLLERRKTTVYMNTTITAHLAVDVNNDLYLLTYGDSSSAIRKYNTAGLLVKQFSLKLPQQGNNLISPSGFAIDKAGTMLISDRWGGVIHQLSKLGTYAGTIGKTTSGHGSFPYPQSIAIDGIGFMYVIDNFDMNTIKVLRPDGNVLKEYNEANQKPGIRPLTISVTEFGDLFVANNAAYPIKKQLKIFSASGALQKVMDLPVNAVATNKSGTLLAARLDGGAIQIFTIDNGPTQRFITGKIYNDVNGNCLEDQTENGLAGMVVEVSPGPYYGITDAAGFYKVPVDTGTYKIKVLPSLATGISYLPTCPTSKISVPVKVTQEDGVVQGPNLGFKVSYTPYLSVNVSSDRRRRCFRNTTTVTYSNAGYGAAQDARVIVQIPEFVHLISASAPFTRDHTGNYVFEVGNLAGHQKGVISIIDSVTCADPSIRGLTVCTKAWITPANPEHKAVDWNRANMVVNGEVQEDGQVRFTLHNSGSGDMTDSLSYRVLQDGDLSLNGKYRLAAGDSLTLRFTPEARALRVEADQPLGHPVKRMSSANVEVRSKNDGIPSPAMNALPPDDPEPEIAIDCLPIIDSYDPNDKQVIPAGLTSEKYTPTNTPLRYTIRFQNTGTDVAYRVVVVDTLSADLNLSTLQMGTVTHPYRLTVTGKERPVLTFTFDNIMLPDSAKDLAGSNGLLQFSIRPKTTLPEKQLIENFADIFFDYNEPVRTNTTVNRIYNIPPVVGDKQLQAKEVVVSPSIVSFSPVAGKPGTDVTISGNNFLLPPGQNNVFFNGIQAPVLEATNTILKVQVPVGALIGKIKVSTPTGSSTTFEDFTVYQPPVLTGLSVTEGTIGAEVTLQGHNLRPDLLESITLGTVTCQIARYANNGVIISIPQGASSGVFTVNSKGGTAQSTAFRVWQSPVLGGFNQARQRVGGNIILQGENFAPEASRNQVLFGDIAAKVLTAQEQLVTVQVPAGAVTGTVKITTPGGSSSKSFEVIPAPVITHVLPNAASIGTVVELKGAHFQTMGHQDTITLGNVKAEVLSASPTVLQVRVPRGAVSGFVTVAGMGGTSKADFRVLPLTPQESIEVYPSPNQGRFTIDFLKADFDVQSVQMLDKTGRTIHQQAVQGITNSKMDIVLPNVPAGIYILLLQTNQGVVTKRVVIQ